MKVLKQLRETASSAWTCVKRNGSKLAAKGSAYALALGTCAYGASAMAQETDSTWPTASSVLGGLQDSLGPWLTMALELAALVFVLKLGWNKARSFLFRS